MAAGGSGCEIRPLSHSTIDGRDAEGVRLAAQRRNARRLGLLLLLVVAVIVGGAFSFVLGYLDPFFQFLNLK